MLYFAKSQPAPDCLAIEKNKKSGTYRCGCVVERLEKDFHGKCYICGTSDLFNINIEHFVPHRDVDKDLKFSWDNLFLCCTHCNNTKGAYAKYDNILNCTDLNDNVENKISCQIDPFPGEKVKVTELDEDERTFRTANLIRNVFNGETDLKRLESAKMRDSLLKEMVSFVNDLDEYFNKDNNEAARDHFLIKIQRHIAKSSNFSSFKRRVVKNKEYLLENFGHLLD